MANFEPWLANVWDEHRDPAARLIELVSGADPGFDEGIKWGNPCFAIGGALRCYVTDCPENVHTDLFNSAAIICNRDLVEGNGRRLRHVKVAELTPEPARRLKEIVPESASLPQSASGWTGKVKMFCRRELTGTTAWL